MEIMDTLINNLAIPILTAFFGYLIGRKSKIDEVQIKKRYELAEQLAVLLQMDFENRLKLRKEYHVGFDHMRDFSQAMGAYDKHQNLYSNIRGRIKDVPTNHNKLKEINQKANIFLPKNISSTVQEYLDLTYFTYTSDGIGLIDTFDEDCLKNILDEQVWKGLSNHYDFVLDQLRKALK